jgi:hypothetical protein
MNETTSGFELLLQPRTIAEKCALSLSKVLKPDTRS